MMVPVDILMLTTGNWQYAKRAILALAHRTADPYRLIVVDSGSGDGTQEILTDCVQDGLISTLVLLPPACRAGDAWKAGIALVEGDVFIHASDEWLPPPGQPGWLAVLIEAMAQHPQYAFIALLPSFFPRGRRALEQDGELALAPWTEVSFRAMRRGHGSSSLCDRAGYLLELKAEYLPKLALGIWK